MKVWRYGDDVNTDQLFPGKYTYSCSFAAGVQAGDVIVAGRNFGCGSSREQPVLGLRAAGIAGIVAESFARIFFRAAVNQGLVLIESPAAVGAWAEGDEIILDPAGGMVRVGTETFRVPPLPPLLLEIREAGGLLPAVRARLAAERDSES